MNWDNIQLFLALFRAGSLREGASLLNISHPTARRRLGLLEKELGVKLFLRNVDGLTPTPEAIELLEDATTIENAVLAMQRKADASPTLLRGEIRLSVSLPIVETMLMPILGEFQVTNPDVNIRVIESNDVVDLDKRAADIALRVVRKGQAPKDNLIGRRVAEISQAVYGEGDHWLGWSTPDEDAGWIARSPFPNAPIGMVMSGIFAQRAACKAGLGMALLPCVFASPELRKRSEPFHAFDLWVVVHPDLKNQPALRAFRDHLYQSFKRVQPTLRGDD